jgi:hypothetical protein
MQRTNFAISDGNKTCEEVGMTALIKKTQWRIVRWFKEFSERNRPPYRWYEHDQFGI